MQIAKIASVTKTLHLLCNLIFFLLSFFFSAARNRKKNTHCMCMAFVHFTVQACFAHIRFRILLVSSLLHELMLFFQFSTWAKVLRLRIDKDLLQQRFALNSKISIALHSHSRCHRIAAVKHRPLSLMRPRFFSLSLTHTDIHCVSSASAFSLASRPLSISTYAFSTRIKMLVKLLNFNHLSL